LRDEVEFGTRPLEAGRWAGAIDNVGGDLLAWITRTTDSNGNIACVGMAASVELNSSDLRPRHLDQIVTNTVSLEQLPAAFQQYIDGGVVGRTVVSILPP
jgi:NADPH2:quinone reductase